MCPADMDTVIPLSGIILMNKHLKIPIFYNLSLVK